MSQASETLALFCPDGYPVDGVSVDQDWENGTTTLTLKNLTIIVDGPTVTVKHETAPSDSRVGDAT